MHYFLFNIFFLVITITSSNLFSEEFFKKFGFGLMVSGSPSSLDFSDDDRFNKETHLYFSDLMYQYGSSYEAENRNQAREYGYYGEGTDLGISNNVNLRAISLSGKFNEFHFLENAYMPNIRKLEMDIANDFELASILPAFPNLNTIEIGPGHKYDKNSLVNKLQSLINLPLDSLVLNRFSAEHVFSPEAKEVLFQLQGLKKLTIIIPAPWGKADWIKDEHLIIANRIEFQQMLPETQVTIFHDSYNSGNGYP